MSSLEQFPPNFVELKRTEMQRKGMQNWFEFIWRFWTSSFGRSRDSQRIKSEEKVLGMTLNLSLNNQRSPLSGRIEPESDDNETRSKSSTDDRPDAVLEFVPINDGKDWINTLKLCQKPAVDGAFDFYSKDESKKNLVIAHGFGAGLGFFYRNYPQLARLQNYNVFAIDWLGMGSSSRPSFPRKGKDEQLNIQQADEFFTSSLEEWRKKMKMEKMTLVGHSLGGYLSVKYAIKYPERVEKLILVSPVGVPKQEPIPVEKLDPEFKPSMFFRFAQRLWTWEISPQSILRSLGPFGQIFTNRYATRRFELGSAALGEYIYQISTGRGSGEYSAPRLLYPFFTGIRETGTNGEIVKKLTGGIYAKTPLTDYLHILTMPTTFIYGSHDWMDHKHAVKAAPLLKVPAKVCIVDKAGHHLYLDAPEAFNHALISELDGEMSSCVKRDDVTYVYL